jgi:protein SCO1/2
MRATRRGSVTAAAAVLAGAAAFLGSGPALADQRWGADYFPNVELITQDGKTVRLYDDLLKGKSVAINVIFTDCKDVCPLETATLVQLRRHLGGRVGKDIFFYSISVDPTRDTPEVLKAYGEKFGAGGPGWQFLTGKPEDIQLATKKLGLARTRDALTRDGHGSILMVGNEPTGQWMKNSALDNPAFLAGRIGGFLGWKDVVPQASYADAQPLSLDAGKNLFESRCAACHSIGQGDKLGPDLAGVTARRERAWLTRYIRVPDQVLAEGDPTATTLLKKYKDVRMPNLRLSSGDAADLLTYVEAQTSVMREKALKESAHPHDHAHH